jgi:peptidyl-prolyl cis-trans isomerase B (cyclophilin B)
MKEFKLLLLCFVLIGTMFSSCTDGKTYVLIETDYGNMKAELFNSTPVHKENFIKLVKENFYDSLMFHRIIPGFMIQGGDPTSKNAAPGQALGMGSPGYTLDAEIGAPHFKGALATARTPDAGNPEKKSNGSQFFIVQGSVQSDDMLNSWEARKGFKYNAAQREKYKTVGGYPPLDNDYTVFGEVVEGLDVIDKIIAVQRDVRDRPLQDIRMKIKLVN